MIDQKLAKQLMKVRRIFPVLHVIKSFRQIMILKDMSKVMGSQVMNSMKLLSSTTLMRQNFNVQHVIKSLSQNMLQKDTLN